MVSNLLDEYVLNVLNKKQVRNPLPLQSREGLVPLY